MCYDFLPNRGVLHDALPIILLSMSKHNISVVFKAHIRHERTLFQIELHSSLGTKFSAQDAVPSGHRPDLDLTYRTDREDNRTG